MKTRSRKLLRRAAGIVTFAAIAGNACVTAAAANPIGQIDAAGLLDIHAAADNSSEVLGQVMDEGHVAILEKADGWVCIMAGTIVGWIPQENLTEAEVSWEEAHEANQKVIAEFTEEIEEILEEQETKEKAEEGETSPEETAEAISQEATETDLSGKLAEEAVMDGTMTGATASAEAMAYSPEAEEKEAELEGAQLQTLEEPTAPVQSAAPQSLAAPEIQPETVQTAGCEEQLQNAQPIVPMWVVENVTPEDIELLANIIYCEAGSESYIGKVAVGNVVVNRVKSERYPSTIRDVIYERGQFSPVRSGRMEKALRNSSADSFCYQAAIEALAGSRPVADLLHFRRVNGRAGLVIGNHVFY